MQKKLSMLKFQRGSPAAEQLPYVTGHVVDGNYILVPNPHHSTNHALAYLKAAYAALLDLDVIKEEELVQ